MKPEEKATGRAATKCRLVDVFEYGGVLEYHSPWHAQWTQGEWDEWHAANEQPTKPEPTKEWDQWNSSHKATWCNAVWDGSAVPELQEERVHATHVANHHRHRRVDLETVGVPVHMAQVGIVNVVAEQIVDVHVPHEKEEIVHEPKVIPQECIAAPSMSEIPEVQVIERTAEVSHKDHGPVEHIIEQAGEVPVPLTKEETAPAVEYFMSRRDFPRMAIVEASDNEKQEFALAPNNPERDRASSMAIASLDWVGLNWH